MGESSTTPTTPIIITQSKTRKCSLLCDVEFKYTPGITLKSLLKNDNGQLTNYDDAANENIHMEIQPNREKPTDCDITFNGSKYIIQTFSVHTDALHTFSEKSPQEKNGEIAILHKNVNGKNDWLLLCIPLSQTSGFSQSVDFFQEWVPLLPLTIDTYDDRVFNVSETWSFMQLLPARKSFYLYNGAPVFQDGVTDTGTVSCVVMQEAATIGSAEFERLAGINKYVTQNPKTAVAPPDGIFVYYNDGLNVAGNRSLGEVDVVCEAVDDTESECAKKNMKYASDMKKIDNGIFLMLAAFLLLSVILLIMKWPNVYPKYFEYVRLSGSMLILSVVLSIYFLIGLGILSLYFVPAILVQSCIFTGMIVWYILFTDSGIQQMAWSKCNVEVPDTFGERFSAFFDPTASQAKPPDFVKNANAWLYGNAKTIIDFFKRENYTIKSYTNAIFIFIAIATMCMFAFLFLLAAGFIKPPDFTFKQFTKAGTNTKICQNIVRYADARENVPLDECKNEVKLADYITDPDCEKSVLQKYQANRISKKYKTTYSAFNSAVKDAINENKCDDKATPDYSLKNYNIPGGHTYNMCTALNKLRGTDIKCDTISILS